MVKMISFTVLIAALSSCNAIKKNAKHELVNGFYKQNGSGSSEKVYVTVTQEDIEVYPAKKEYKKYIVDTTLATRVYSAKLKTVHPKRFSLSKYNFDVDFLTIPLKYRAKQLQVPPQLNANINGAVYFGLRSDVYHVSYTRNPLQVEERHTHHVGFSAGFFTGLGNTFMSPTNTNEILNKEYDGVLWSKGIAAIIGINRFSVGLSVGFDNLLDKNKTIWIYEGKPWVGLAFGLHLY